MKSEEYTVMVVDDNPANLRLLSELLHSCGHFVRALPSGDLAVRSATRDPPDLVLLDVDMPDMDGFEACRRLKNDSRTRDIPVMFISALNDSQSKVKGFKSGAVDYIAKPVRFEEVEARVRTHLTLRRLQAELAEQNIRLEERVTAQVEEIADAQMATIYALAKLAEFRDDATGRHVERVSSYSRVLAQGIGKSSSREGSKTTPSFVRDLHHASPLHDIGKVGISDAILLKPGKLTAEEFATIKQHTVIGAKTLRAVQVRYPRNQFVAMGAEIARWHHEKWDGSGYPDGLGGENIPLSARIVAVADVYDALRSKRPYKPPFSHEKASDIIFKDCGLHFDPAVVEVFRRSQAEFVAMSAELGV